ncbi:MAG: glycine cleavage system protein GcvH [Candidatus Woesearchaeota archaeon]
MAQVKDIILPDEFYYHKSHSYAKREGDIFVIGIDMLGVRSIGGIEYIELPQKGARVTQGKPFARVESAKWVGEVTSPLSGEVIEVNTKVVDSPELVKNEPYNSGWLIKIRPVDVNELSGLITGKAVEEWLIKEQNKGN